MSKRPRPPYKTSTEDYESPPYKTSSPRGNGSAGMPILNGAPWYVKVGAWMLMWFGFPVIMTVMLFGVIVGYIPSPMLTTDQHMREHREETRPILKYIESSTRVLRQICRNTSTNRLEQIACD